MEANVHTNPEGALSSSASTDLSLSASPQDGQKLKNAGLGCRPPARPRPPARARAAKARVPEKDARAGVRGLLLTTFPAPCCLLGRHDISAASSTIGRGVEVTGTAVVICVIA